MKKSYKVRNTAAVQTIREAMMYGWVPVMETGKQFGIHPDTLASWVTGKTKGMSDKSASFVNYMMSTNEWVEWLMKWPRPEAAKHGRYCRSAEQRERYVRQTAADQKVVESKQIVDKTPATDKHLTHIANVMKGYTPEEVKYLVSLVWHRDRLDAMLLAGYRAGEVK